MLMPSLQRMRVRKGILLRTPMAWRRKECKMGHRVVGMGVPSPRLCKKFKV